MSLRILACAVAVIGMSHPAKAESVLLHAAGSLRGALTEVAAAFAAAGGATAGGEVVTAAITNDSVDALGLRVGSAAAAVIKASDVMVAVDV